MLDKLWLLPFNMGLFPTSRTGSAEEIKKMLDKQHKEEAQTSDLESWNSSVQIWSEALIVFLFCCVFYIKLFFFTPHSYVFLWYHEFVEWSYWRAMNGLGCVGCKCCLFVCWTCEQAAVYKRIHLVMVVDVLPPSGHNIWTLHHKILSICCFFLFLVDKEKVCIDEGSALRY